MATKRQKILFDAFEGTYLISKHSEEILSVFKLFCRSEKKMRRCLGDNWFYSNVSYIFDKLEHYSQFESAQAGDSPKV